MTSRRLTTSAASIAASLLAGALALTGCATGLTGAAQTTTAADSPTTSEAAPTTDGPTPTTTAPEPPTTTTEVPAPTVKPTSPATSKPPKPPKPPKPTRTPTPSTTTPTPTPTPTEGDTLHPGDHGAYVLSVQRRLSDLGYWLGTPDGTYGYLTSQAVMALQKASGLGRDGVYGPSTRRALQNGVRPQSRLGGTGVEIDKARQLLLVVRGGRVTTILNTSTGNGQPYDYEGRPMKATTPSGSFSVFRTVDKLDKGPLGDLWRPRYFNGGIAVHGSGSVPAYPASHGCARVSNPAMNMIWASNLMPVGSRVAVY